MHRFARTLRTHLLFRDKDDSSIHLSKFTVHGRRSLDQFIDNAENESRLENGNDIETLRQYTKSTSHLLTKSIDDPSHSQQRQRSNCERADIEFIHRLINDPNITIKPADKNLGITLVDTEWYDHELNRMLSDTNTYRKFKNELTIEKKKIKCKSDKLGEHLWDHLQSIVKIHHGTLAMYYPTLYDQVIKYTKSKIGKTTSTIPIIYGLLKVHKPKLSMRPIVPCTNWITTPASVLVDHLLQSIVRDANIKWIVKDTKSFVNELEATHLTCSTGILCHCWHCESVY